MPNGIVGTNTYDDASHVTGMSYALGQTSVGDLSYTYDAVGHRTSVGGSLARVSLPAALSGATYDAANRLTAWDATSPTYDLTGQMTSDGTKAFTWNARGELVDVAQGQITVATYAYDAFGRRASKTLSGTTTRFAYDGPNFIQEQDGAGGPTANLLTGGVDQSFGRTDGAGSGTFLTDALGSTVALSNGSGAITTSYTYEPFGATTPTGATSANSQQFTGRENDGPLYYYRARYLSPTFGRFLSEDPLGFAAGDPNLYGYAGGDPTDYRDPSGELLPLLGAAAVACFGNAVFSVVGDVALELTLGDRKFTLGQLGEGAVLGCAGGLIGFGALRLITPRLAVVADAASFARSQFRVGLGRLTGGVRVGFDAHHVFPQKFLPTFRQIGIDIHNPLFGQWWEAGQHRALAYEYNQAWTQFLRTNPNATVTEVLEFGRQLMSQFGLPVLY